MFHIPGNLKIAKTVAQFIVALLLASCGSHTQYLYTGARPLESVAVLIWEADSKVPGSAGANCGRPPTDLTSIDGTTPKNSGFLINRAELVPGRHHITGVASYSHSTCRGSMMVPPAVDANLNLIFSLDVSFEPGTCYTLRTELVETELGNDWSAPSVKKLDATSTDGPWHLPDRFYRLCALR
jgi:hypothetical protein